MACLEILEFVGLALRNLARFEEVLDAAREHGCESLTVLIVAR